MKIVSSHITQIIPNITKTIARFRDKDGTINEYPVICWVIREVVTQWEDDEEFSNQEIVGQIIMQGSPFLSAVDSDDARDEFIEYFY